jgi:Zn-dependent protease
VTPVNESNMPNPRWHGAIVSLAGPVVNIIFVVIAMLGFAAVVESGDHVTLASVLLNVAFFNAFLAVFNLLPIPPLDGAHILGAFMDAHTRREWRKLDEYGMFIIIGLIVFGGASFSSFVLELSSRMLDLACDLVNCPTGLG